jgi:hypothetical protein
MYLLPITIVFLVLFSIFSSSELSKIKDSSLYVMIQAKEEERIFAKEQEGQREKARDKFTALCPPEQNIQNPQEGPRRTLHRENPEDLKRSRTLDVRALFTKQQEGVESSTKVTSSKELLKNLIRELYANTNFFQEAKKKRPHLEEELIESLQNGAKSLSENNLLKTEKDLANIRLKDESLQEVLYKILKGHEAKEGTGTLDELSYPSLLDFLTFDSRHTLIGIWLTKKPLLLALFQNAKVVDDLCQERERVYQSLRQNEMKKEELEAGLKNRLLNSLPQNIDSALIDFKISTTRPPHEEQ